MVDLRSALALAKQYRTCPPLRVLEDSDASAFAQEHLSVCPYCATQRGGEKEWAELVDSLQAQFPARTLAEEEIRPGQIRFVGAQMAVWRAGFYYNPPGVLVLEKTAGVPDGYRVAQIYHDVSLAAPGDLVLDDGRTGAGDLMVECLNTYSMKGSYLGPAVGQVTDEVVAAVIRMEKEPAASPAWAVKPAPMEEHDVRTYFREMEVEVGYVFASGAVLEIMQDLEKAHPVLIYGSAEKMKAEVKRKVPGLVWPETFATLEEALVSARLPLESYAMAAADDENEVEPANFVWVAKGHVKAIQLIQVEILERNPTVEGLVIGGRIIDMPRDDGERRLLAFLAREGRGMLPAVDVQWDEPTGHFTSTFKTEDPEYGRLKIAVFCYVDAD